MHKRLSSFLLGLVAFVALAEADACSPAQRAAIPVEEKAACVVLRALDPSIAPYCATADELAPFVPELIASSSQASTSTTPIVAFSMPAPRRSAPRRHCAKWESSVADAGTDAP